MNLQTGHNDHNPRVDLVGNVTRPSIAIALFTALLVSGCDNALDGIGELSRQVVHGDAEEIAATTTPESTGLGLKGISDLVWWNDALDALGGGRSALIRDVWGRGDGVSAYVQASRSEIAVALPGIEFPKLAPEAVTHVTSQLVYDPQTALLDAATSAAFGLWAGEPYVAPRSEAQLAVLRVGLATSGEQETTDISSFGVGGGRELAWVDGDYVYQLFCRTGISEESCFAIAESTAPLAVLTVIQAPADT
jgi:hypothetical protein